MVRPDQVLQSIAHAIDSSGRLPDATSYATFEIDDDGGQANVRPPVVEVTNTGTVRSRPHNTDVVRFATDDRGNQIGRIYHALFEMDVEIDVWTAEGDGYNPESMGEQVRRALYRYDDTQRGDPLPDPDPDSDPNDQESVGPIDYFVVDDGSVANDLTMTPALERRCSRLLLW